MLMVKASDLRLKYSGFNRYTIRQSSKTALKESMRLFDPTKCRLLGYIRSYIRYYISLNVIYILVSQQLSITIKYTYPKFTQSKSKASILPNIIIIY